MKIVLGEEHVTRGPPADTADKVHGGAWVAEMRNGRCMLTYDGGGIAAEDKVLEISADEFERLRADKSQFLPVLYAHGR